MSVTSLSTPRLQIGVSSCLAGNRVRYDGKHKMDYFLTGTLGQFVDLRAYCPEVAIGLGIPRPPIQLRGDVDHPRVKGIADPSLDVTEPLWDYGHHVATKEADLDAYIFKAGSPSCGISGVKLVGKNGHVERIGQGVFAASMGKALPNLPVAEESDLGDAIGLEKFVQRAVAYRRWRQCTDIVQLDAFLTSYELWFEVAGIDQPLAKQWAAQQYLDCVQRIWMQPLRPKDHSRVMRRLLGELPPQKAAAIAALMDTYEANEIPRSMPLTVLIHALGQEADTAQHYLNMDWLVSLANYT